MSPQSNLLGRAQEAILLQGHTANAGQPGDHAATA
jgi:hypothetical protein